MLFLNPIDALHARIGKAVVPAFIEKAIREKEPVLQRCAELLVGKLKTIGEERIVSTVLTESMAQPCKC
jgi:hypothetical protein